MCSMDESCGVMISRALCGLGARDGMVLLIAQFQES